MPANAPGRAELEAQGWVIKARSFGARLDPEHVDQERLTEFIDQVEGIASVRELSEQDVDAVLALDAATSGDYPGSTATQHAPLDRGGATPSADRIAFGAFLPTGELVATTYVDVDGAAAETDFTVVHRVWRGRGLAVAVKAASVLALTARGTLRLRTGGSSENVAIIAANVAIGYIQDEDWVTLTRSE